VRPPYPLAPLLSQFLQRRRAKMTSPLRMMEEHGLDRPAYFWVVNLSYRGAKGATATPGDLESPYSTIPKRWLSMAAAARGAGLAEERAGSWQLTEKGRQLARRQHEAAREHYRTLAPLPDEELAKLAALLDSAFAAAARAPLPEERLRTPWAFAYRAEDPPPGSFAELDAAVFGLWQVRDDCHMAAWRAAGLPGPEVEVLTRVWRNEAADEAALIDLLPHQRPEDVTKTIARFRQDGRMRADAFQLTDRAARLRQKIEDETDRLFFSPWPDDVGANAKWIADKLAAVNAALA
jgi:helix-turn-helix protein